MELHKAIYAGNTALVQDLIASGSNVNSQDNIARIPPIMLAIQYRYIDIIRMLLDAGADVNLHDDHGWNALILASRKEAANIIRMLLDAGADVNMRTNEGWTALMLACFHHHHEVVELLLKQQAELHHRRHSDGKTAYDLAKPKDIRLLPWNSMVRNRDRSRSYMDHEYSDLEFTFQD